MSMFLPASEVERLTRRKRYTAQVRHLARRGIKCTTDADGRPLVLRSALEAMLGHEEAHRKASAQEPDWSAL